MKLLSRDTLVRALRGAAPLGLLAALALGLAACSSGDGGPSASAQQPAATSAAPSDEAPATSDVQVLQPGKPGEGAETGGPVEVPEPGFNHSDVAFVQMMIPHHGQAIEMAELADEHAVDPTVRTLAERIRGVQGPEIVAMSSWLEERNIDVPTTAQDPAELDHGEHGHDAMMGMRTAEQMAELAEARGAAFDRLFLEGMIAHHEGAIAMADTVAAHGEDLRVAEIAADVNVTQRVEIDRMQGLLDR